MAVFYIGSGRMVLHSTFGLWHCAAHSTIPDSSHPYKWDVRGSVYAIYDNAYPFLTASKSDGVETELVPVCISEIPVQGANADSTSDLRVGLYT